MRTTIAILSGIIAILLMTLGWGWSVHRAMLERIDREAAITRLRADSLHAILRREVEAERSRADELAAQAAGHTEQSLTHWKDYEQQRQRIPSMSDSALARIILWKRDQ